MDKHPASGDTLAKFMSILKEQINAIDYVGKFLEDIRFGPRMPKKELAERIHRLTRHYPTTTETKMWHEWLLKGKGHE